MVELMFVIFIMVATCNATKKACQSSEDIFVKMKDNGDALSQKDFISSHVVYDVVECSFKCLKQQQCVGLNFLETAKEHEINCQISNTTIKDNSKIMASSGKWTFYQTIYSRLAVNILKSSRMLQVKNWLPSNLKDNNTVHCYQATVNGWKASTFHSLCDNKGPTLVFVKVGSYVFGGFASESWGGKLQ
ncbi:uncharacterized protein LOC124454699 [Xenia sp. Carnegie-2017]|uniref:uncharacterized protein LOC124454699 n=1 Tax=Xenia sp. Carnegie-2017 TaxID=2897299 RepID=UPI001F03DDDC|nr:uncharacterized protein LOC124454699 [Xenia sp. Carnegie-2017]